MSSSSKTVITKNDDPDSRAVLAYRVGQLEKITIEGLEKLNTKLDDLTHNFATMGQLDAVEKQAKREREVLGEADDATNKRISKIENWLSWGTKIVLAIVITAVVGLVLVDKTGGL